MAKDPMLVTLVAAEVKPFIQEFAPRHDDDGVQVNAGQNSLGQEVPDPVPVAPPVGYMSTPDLKDIIREMILHEGFRRQADAEGVDNFEEGEDFDIEDDPLDPETPYEAEFDPEWVKIKEAYAARLKGPHAWADWCKANGLTEDGKTYIRGKSIKDAKENDDGDTSVDQGRNKDRARSPGKSGKVVQDDGGAVKDGDDEGGG